jgi:hypothetical protein
MVHLYFREFYRELVITSFLLEIIFNFKDFALLVPNSFIDIFELGDKFFVVFLL